MNHLTAESMHFQVLTQRLPSKFLHIRAQASAKIRVRVILHDDDICFFLSNEALLGRKQNVPRFMCQLHVGM